MYMALLVGGCAGGSGGDGDPETGPTGIVVEQTVVVENVDDVIVEADRLIVPRSTHPELLELEPGELLVGDRASGDYVTQKNPDGFIRKVVAVGATEDSIVIDTELAYLTDIIAEGTFSETIAPVILGELPPVPLVLDRTDQISAVPGSPAAIALAHELPLAGAAPTRLNALGAINFSGLKLGPHKIKPPTPIKTTIKGVPTNIEPSATILVTIGKGTFTFNPSADLSLDIGLIDGLREFRFALLGDLVADLSTNIDLTLALNAGVDFGQATDAEKAQINKDFENWALNGGGFPAFDTQITSATVNLPTWWLPTTPPVPVVSTLGFNLRLLCSVGRLAGTASVTAAATGEGNVTVGSRWQKDIGWTPLSERSWDVVSEEQSLTGAVSLTAGCTLKPRLELIFYGMAGPNVYMNATSQAEFKAAQSCPGQLGVPKVDVTLDIIEKLSAGVGARLGIIAAGVDITIAEANIDLFSEDFSAGKWTLWSGYPEPFGGFGWCSENIESCGDGLCNAEEDCMTCEEDCGGCESCGDGMCSPSESCGTCEADCGACPPSCGDGVCGDDEDCSSCSDDCGACPAYCGDNQCNNGETCESCAADCGVCPAQCGDGQCNGGESCGNCEADCGACPPSCGDAMCNNGENCWSCPADCGACPAQCGDGQCNGNETCSTCEADCGACPDPCVNAGDGDGWYCGKNIGGISKVLYECSGPQTSNTISCGYGCAGCPPGKADVCKDYQGQTDVQACSDGPVCSYDEPNVCGGSSQLWCYQGQCKQCSLGFSNCDGTQGCECDGYCGFNDTCCKPDDCNANCPLC